MNFLQIKPDQFIGQFSEASERLRLSLQAGQQKEDEVGEQMLAAMQQTTDIMRRMWVDQQSGKHDALDATDVSKVGSYGLELLDELSVLAVNRGLQEDMLRLQRLAIPLALWIAEQGGHIDQLELVVNAFASYANEIRDAERLLQLSQAIGLVVASVNPDIQRDLEASNPMRPWRIINLNWGIIATRSHDVEEMNHVFAQLMKNIPADVRQFFHEGMQQMDVVGYPDYVREVMAHYNQLMGDSESLH